MRQIIQIAAVSLALALTLPASAGEMAGTESAASVLSRIESNVDDIRTQSDRLMGYNRFPEQHDWRLHASELHRIKLEADDVASLIDKFEGIKDDVTYRQRYAFNQFVPLMAKISDAAEQAIKTLNENRSKVEVAHPDYANQVTEIFHLSGDALSTLDVAESWFELQESWQSD